VSASSAACLALLTSLLVGCAHEKPDAPPADVLTVTELAARFALEEDVPAVLREASPVCLEVDGQPPAPQVLARLSSTVQVSSSASACGGPRAVLLQVSGVVVSGDTAVAHAGVRLGPTQRLEFRRVEGRWRVVRPAQKTGAGPVLTLP
jgi:hypothetical protein